MNTVGQSLRNANLQIRSEPANPVSNVSPWLNTTISPDLERRPLEICSDDVAAAFNVVGLGGGSEEFASLVASTWPFRARAFQKKTFTVETVPRDDHSSKNQPKRVENDRDRSL